MLGIHPYLSNKLLDGDRLREQVLSWKGEGKTVGFTNGVFDLLHPGHVNYLQEAASRVDHLILGLNSDASVKRLGKGGERPINDETARSVVLAGLHAVAAVTIFKEDTPLKLIESISPHFLFKGGDYDPSNEDVGDRRYIVGSHHVRAAGGMVEAIPLVDGFSTSDTLKKILGHGN